MVREKFDLRFENEAFRNQLVKVNNNWLSESQIRIKFSNDCVIK